MSRNKSPRHGEGMNARAPLTSLTRSHAQRGWSGFDRCMVYAMQGLAICLPSKSGEGRTTAYQVAMASRITDRWAREGLKRLENAGLISWERGGIGPDGQPRPSWIRVDKKTYLAWIQLREWVKRKRDAAVARYQAYRERVSKIEHAPQPEPVAPKPAPEPVTPARGGSSIWERAGLPKPERAAAAAPAAPKIPTRPPLPCEEAYTPEQVSEMKERILMRGYDSLQLDRMLQRPVPGWRGWMLARDYEAQHGLDERGVDIARDPEGRLLKRPDPTAGR